ncbi:MAG: DJ-1/PfpI family protein, partial [Vicinamibacterales bacterium]
MTRRKVVVIPAESAASPAYTEWLQRVHAGVDVMMSVCAGAFILGKAGLLDGRAATTHHGFFNQFAAAFSEAELRRGLRFFEGHRGDPISSAGGLTSGINLALRVVERYFGRD